MMCSPAAMPILGDSHDRRPSSTFHDLGRLGGIVVRGRTHDPPFLKLIFGLRERVISRGLFFGSPRPYGMWHENAISHPPREVELG
jgi:hypothetical protein